ncbi:MAG TPA: N-acetylmuramoyl-L-alanine amidase [Verrucomicrobiota bacterium]|mgnify:CR=1 FL=1|nr:N-acetylmuramoyl-L-alanine amidase [Verrucomicrobiota bacterium]
MSRAGNIFPLALRLKCCLITSMLLAAFSMAASEKTYVVKRSDTLYGIARTNGITVAQLADHNKIPRDTRVVVGQRLIIPDRTTKTNPQPSTLSAPIQKHINIAPVEAKRWKHIVIHHSGVDEGNLKAIDRYHREERHMENGMAYHFLIGNGNGMGDGEIAVGNRWKKQLDGGHLRNLAQNKTSIGICLVGNFEKKPPTKRQLESLENLIRALMKRCNLTTTAVKTHQQINVIHTKCPGTKFPTKSFLENLKSTKT